LRDASLGGASFVFLTPAQIASLGKIASKGGRRSYWRFAEDRR
jgi:hypothetical protein